MGELRIIHLGMGAEAVYQISSLAESSVSFAIVDSCAIIVDGSQTPYGVVASLRTVCVCLWVVSCTAVPFVGKLFCRLI